MKLKDILITSIPFLYIVGHAILGITTPIIREYEDKTVVRLNRENSSSPVIIYGVDEGNDRILDKKYGLSGVKGGFMTSEIPITEKDQEIYENLMSSN